MSIPSTSDAEPHLFEWFDAHCHLQDPRLAPYLNGVLNRARAAGVGRLHVNATSECDWNAVAALADAHSEIICSFGIHPWFLDGRSPDWLVQLRSRLSHRPAGIGEIGLDGKIETSMTEQVAVFRAQLDLSIELALPASLHCRAAWDEMLPILLARDPHPAGLLIHAYSGPVDAIAKLAGKNVFFSFGGSLTRPNAPKTIERAKNVPQGRFLIESDAPDMPPTIFEQNQAIFDEKSGKILSEPAFLTKIGQKMAEIRQISTKIAAKETTETARCLFAKLLD